MLGWLKDLISSFGQHQMTHLHFRQLKPDKQAQSCEAIANLPVRCFSVLSHKRNMRAYKNIHAERAKVNKTAWFYCWMTRLLLERVTDYCSRRSMKEFGESRRVRVEMSDRGGVRLADVRAYYDYLRSQSQLGMVFHARYDLVWDVFDPAEIQSFPNRTRAGLQLADCIASAFFAGLERAADGSTKPHLAKLLAPRMCTKWSRTYGYGVKVMPTWIPSALPPEQNELLKFYMSYDG